MPNCRLQQLDSGRWFCPACDPEQKRTLPVNAHRNCRAATGYTPTDPLTARLAGPGSSLKRLLSRIGIVATGSCGCNSMAAKMDSEGPAWCRAHLEEIVDVMEAEAAKRKLPFVRIGAKALIRLAIRSAEKKTA